MLAGNKFTENFNAVVPEEIFRNVYNNIHNCLYWRIYQLLFESNQFVGNKCRASDFLKKQKE